MWFNNFLMKNKISMNRWNNEFSDSIISDDMKEAITLWRNMYENKAPWTGGNIKSMNIASAICSEIARLTVIELKISVGGSLRGEYIQRQMDKILPSLRNKLELACALGSIAIKPYIKGKSMYFDFVAPDRFFPKSVNENGEITEAVFVQRLNRGGRFFTRLESHFLKNNRYIIENTVFVSNSEYDTGREITLAESGIWTDMSQRLIIENIKTPLFTVFKVPFANTVDINSPLGVSVFSRATELIEEADKQFSRLLWEYESGERALYLDETAFKRDKTGKPLLPDKRLYRMINSGEGELFKDWSPQIRDESINRGLDSILIKIEDICGLARGTFSKADITAKTATELKITRQRSYSTICDMQKALKFSLEKVIEIIDIWCDIYHIVERGEYSSGFEFDDSIICDTDKEFEQKLELTRMGIMSNEEFRMWYFGEDKPDEEKIPSKKPEKARMFI